MKIKLLLAGLVLSVVTPMAQANAGCETGYESTLNINATTNVATHSCVKSERQIAQLAQGAWVKVDANGNATGQAIVCSADVCGDSKSPYATATLKEGEQYVLQAVADPITNNVAGVGNNNANTQVQVDLPTQEWTITRTNTATPKEPVFINGQQVTSYTYQTVDKFTADKAPWVYTKESVEEVVEPEIEAAVVEEVKTKPVKAKKAKAKKKAARR
jgi:uncharacterized Fe-S cluster protein YjdI